MLTSDTCDVEAVLSEMQRLVEAECELIRLTVPNQKSVEALPLIRYGMQERGLEVPLVADIHFNPQLAWNACEFVEKVRINPGNYADRKKFEVREYSDAQYADELSRIEEKLLPLIQRLKEFNRALRVGTNHGSLSDRIVNRYGDTPRGMTESAMEFLRILRRHEFHNIIISMKASNPLVMMEAYRELVAQMTQEEMDYPLHLGVTEAGNALDGRVKSAVGIGSLLLEGLGDTIRVSLTEPAEEEIPAARAILDGVRRSHRPPTTFQPPEVGQAFQTTSTHIVQLDDISVGGDSPFKLLGLSDFVVSGLPTEPFDWVGSAAALQKSDSSIQVLDDPEGELPTSTRLLVLRHEALRFATKRLRARVEQQGLKHPIALQLPLRSEESELLGVAAEVGSLIAERALQALVVPTTDATHPIFQVAQMLLQATRVRLFKADFISCPSCGRTHFDLQTTTEAIKERTAHLKGVKIGIMGCVVNGPGEMADADFGYVGSGPGKVNLYKGQECVQRNVPEGAAVEHLIALIKEHGRWEEAV
jgi:(E)-4-hydroxy-3-methylbut-2-enyl-diphosphate synthase